MESPGKRAGGEMLGSREDERSVANCRTGDIMGCGLELVRTKERNVALIAGVGV